MKGEIQKQTQISQQGSRPGDPEHTDISHTGTYTCTDTVSLVPPFLYMYIVHIMKDVTIKRSLN